MADLKVRTRNVGALAVLPPGGLPAVTTPTGGTVDVVTQVSAPGFSPLDLLYAALAGCLVVSARSAAGELGLLERFDAASARVHGEKAADGPSRIATFHVEIGISGDLDAGERARIAARAEELCTVSNTLHGAPRVVLSHG